MKKLIGSTIALLIYMIACDTSLGKSKYALSDTVPRQTITSAKNTTLITTLKVPKFKDSNVQT